MGGMSLDIVIQYKAHAFGTTGFFPCVIQKIQECASVLTSLSRIERLTRSGIAQLQIT